MEDSMLNEEDINNYAARQIRSLRVTTGLTQTQLAREMNVSPQQVQKYEWGINRLTIVRAMQFAEAFDVPVTVFFPKQDGHYSLEPVPPATLRFVRLLSKINPNHYDQVYIALKAIARLSGSKTEE